MFCFSFLAQNPGVLSSKVIRESNVSVYWALGLSVLVGLFVGWLSLLVPPLLLRLLLLSFLFSVACAQEQARASCCLSLLPLDDLTMPPYSLHPPSPMTPLSGHINIFQAESKCWLWLVLLFLLFFFSSSFSVLLLRDTEQVNRAHHTTLHHRERIFLSFSALTAACFSFSPLCL